MRALLALLLLVGVSHADKLTPDEVNQARMLQLNRQLAEMQELLQACEVKRTHGMSDEDDFDPKTLEIVRKAKPAAANPAAVPPKPEATAKPTERVMDEPLVKAAPPKPPAKPKPKPAPSVKAVPK